MATTSNSKTQPSGILHASERWTEALDLLFTIIRETELEETVKWGAPCFTYQGKNILGLSRFKSYVGIWFHQGVFLKDPYQVLVNASEGKTKALRQWRFSSKAEIDPLKVKSYILEAIANAKAGKELKPQRKPVGELPNELLQALSESKKLQLKFNELTDAKKREYAEYIRDAKQVKTRTTRLEKSIPLILQGIGLNDKYK